jgi:hypothetical protein
MPMGGDSSCSQLNRERTLNVGRSVTSFFNRFFVLNRATEEPRRSSSFLSGDEIAFQTAMQLKIRTKFTYGFLVLAFGIMLTDVCRLMLAPSATAITAVSSAQQKHKLNHTF